MRTSWLVVALVPSVLLVGAGACGSQSPSASGGSTAPASETAPPVTPPVSAVPDTPPPLQDDGFDPCAGKTCGETCTICSPTATDCVETMVVKQCNAQGRCGTDPVECPK